VRVEVCGAGAATHRAGDDEVTVTVVGHADHGDVGDARVCAQDRFDLLGVDVEAPEMIMSSAWPASWKSPSWSEITGSPVRYQPPVTAAAVTAGRWRYSRNSRP
jgi:hypothetical protein